MQKIKVAFFGTPEFSLPVLQGLIDNYEVVLVVTQPDKNVGRHHLLTPSPIKKMAENNKIKVFTPEKIRLNYDEVIQSEVDLIVTCAYGQIIPKEILDYPKYGCINVHASLLPKLRGGAPIHRAIINGEEETGITIMYMDEKMDNGDIISQRRIKILDTDNAGILHDKLSVLGRDLLLETLPSIINNQHIRIKQDENLVTFAYNIKREDEKLDFNKTTKGLLNQIRGLYPWPLSYIIINNIEIKVLKAHSENIKSNKTIGEIIDVSESGLYIKTIDGVLVIEKIKPAGKKEVTIKEFLNGNKIENIVGKNVN